MTTTIITTTSTTSATTSTATTEQLQLSDKDIVQGLLLHLENQDPLLYSSLPEWLQKNHRIAVGTIRGITQCLLEDDDGSNSSNNKRKKKLKSYNKNDNKDDFNVIVDYDNYYQQYCWLIETLCLYQPSALFDKIDLFRLSLMPIADSKFRQDCLKHLNRRKIDDDIYQNLTRVLILDNTTSNTSRSIFDRQTYNELLDSMKYNDEIICKLIYCYPKLLRDIPLKFLREEHGIIAVMSHFFFHNNNNNNNNIGCCGCCIYDNNEDKTTDDDNALSLQLRLVDIPRKFRKSMILYYHLSGETISGGRSGGGDVVPRCDGGGITSSQFTFPLQGLFSIDKELCLACLRCCSYYNNCDDNGDESESSSSSSSSSMSSLLMTVQVWIQISYKLRHEDEFMAKAVACNIHVLHHYWTFNEAEGTPLKVLIAAITSHAYEGTFFDRPYNWRPLSPSTFDPITLMDTFDHQVKTQLDHHQQFMVFLQCIVSVRNRHRQAQAPDQEALPPPPSSSPSSSPSNVGWRSLSLSTTGSNNDAISTTSSTSFPTDSSPTTPQLQILCDAVTLTTIKKHIASFVGVPTGTYLGDLRKVWKERERFSEILAGLVK